MMLSLKFFVLLVALPFLVSCLTPVSEDECWKAYKRACMAVRRRQRKYRGDYDSWESSDEDSSEVTTVTTTIATTTEEEVKTWVVFPMNGLGVPNYGEQDFRISEIGLIFEETSRQIVQALRNNMIVAENILPAIRPPLELQQECPFTAPLDCDETYPYRSADGACNNLQFPYFGKSSTPFERYLPAAYSDGIEVPRSSVIRGSDLPSARVVSTNFHTFDTPWDCEYERVHLTVLFGIFLGHDLFDYQVFPVLEDVPEEESDCCISGLSASCYPIEIPEDDVYFGQYNRTCMAFRRSLPSPHLTCSLGSRELLNRATSFIDASQVYGSDLKTQIELRTMIGGLMRTTPTEYMDLLPQTDSFCNSTENNLCFLGGDGRVNLHPLIMAQHNLFVREHNRLANLLGATYPDWSDEALFQEARKYLIAEIQHITINEFLPMILNIDLIETYNLNPLLEGHSKYLKSVHPATRNSFASAAFLFGHSGIKGEISINGSQVPFGSLFYNSDIFYNVSDAASILYEGLTVDLQQRIDRLITEEVTNKLSETETGNGWDLAAINVQSGRDNGLPTYNMWRRWCGLEAAENFTFLVDHKDTDQIILQQLYESVEDIDLWTGGISEIHIPDGNVGPTFACIIARQFQALKFGDRFWYESAGTHQLPIDALNAIRNISMSRLLCDNTLIEQIQINAFNLVSDVNPIVSCTDIPVVDECALVRRYSEWSEWSACVDNQRTRSRVCTAPTQGTCSCEDIQPDTQSELCIEVAV